MSPISHLDHPDEGHPVQNYSIDAANPVVVPHDLKAHRSLCFVAKSKLSRVARGHDNDADTIMVKFPAT